MRRLENLTLALEEQGKIIKGCWPIADGETSSPGR
jgi:hypothetical protein